LPAIPASTKSAANVILGVWNTPATSARTAATS